MRLPARDSLPRLYRVTAIAPSGAVVVGHLVGMRAAVDDAELCVAQGARPEDVTIEATGAGHDADLCAMLSRDAMRTFRSRLGET